MQRIQTSNPPVVFVNNHETLAGYVRGFREGGVVALDTETTGLDIIQDAALFISLSTEDTSIIIHRSLAAGLAPLLNDPDVVIPMHNAKFDMHMMANIGVPFGGAQAHDTIVMAGMSDSSRSSLGLKELAVSLYGEDGARAFRYKDFAETFGSPNKKKGETTADLLLKAPKEKLTYYAGSDAWATVVMYPVLKSLLQQIHNWRGIDLWSLFLGIEVPFTRLLWDCEREGMKVDLPRLRELEQLWSERISEIEKEFAKLAGRPINLRSTPQLRQYFLVDKGLVSNKFTDGGKSGEAKASVDKDVLAEWAAQGVPEVKLLKEHRELSVLLNTFVKAPLSRADQRDRLHTTLNHVGAETGRLSSSDPPMQNIPIRTALGRMIRACFIAEHGHRLIVRDYDQLEMKIAASVAGDTAMIEMINAGRDIHAGNATIAFDMDYDLVMEAVRLKDMLEEEEAKGIKSGRKLAPEQKAMVKARKDAKNIGFGDLYGSGIQKTARQIGCSVEEALAKKAKFKAAFPHVAKDIVRTHEYAKKHHCVQTIMGRFRALPAAAMLRGPAFAKAMRQAYNTRIQGSAADIAKLAMLRVWGDPRIRELGGKLLLQVHDELIVECPEEAADEINERMGYHMEHCLDDIGLRFPVPLTTSGRPCPNWAAGK